MLVFSTLFLIFSRMSIISKFVLVAKGGAVINVGIIGSIVHSHFESNRARNVSFSMLSHKKPTNHHILTNLNIVC